jgi:hypothetical protein
MWRTARLGAGLVTAALAFAPAAGRAEPPSAPVLLDRVVVRWHAPETGGAAKPRFIFERELAFEARLESLADPDPEPGPYHDRHVRAALERHIAETLLASLLPAPDPIVLERQKLSERAILIQRVRGIAKLNEAANAEGIDPDELSALIERHAKASLYINEVIAPMLEPSELELRELLREGATPFKGQPFEVVKKDLSHWYVGQRLIQAKDAYFQNARSRVVLTVARRR